MIQTEKNIVRSTLVNYFINMRLNINGSIFCATNEKIDFEENLFYETFCESSGFFYITINIDSHMYKVAN